MERAFCALTRGRRRLLNSSNKHHLPSLVSATGKERQTHSTWSENSPGTFFRAALVIFLFLEDLCVPESMHKHLS
jgi:hypothetical protein